MGAGFPSTGLRTLRKQNLLAGLPRQKSFPEGVRANAVPFQKRLMFQGLGFGRGKFRGAL
jgi:type IV secretory pathway TrbD component